MKTRNLRWLSLLMAAVLFVSAASGLSVGTTLSVQANELGDVNGDGTINTVDAARVLLATVAKIILNKDQTMAADVNGDGNIAANDATLILLHSVNKKLIGQPDSELPSDDPSEDDKVEVPPMETPDFSEDYEVDFGTEPVLNIDKDTGDEVSIFTDARMKFSKTAGLYDQAFDLTLSGPSGYTVYYTLDGSDPTVSSTRKTYSGPIAIVESAGRAEGAITSNIASISDWSHLSSQFVGTVVRAYATNGTDSTAVVTNTYYVGKDLAETYQVPWVSVTVEKDDFATTNGIYYSARENVTGDKEHIPGYAEFFDETGELQASQHVEVSMAGNGSLVYRQRSMRLYFKDNLIAAEGNPKRLYYDIFNGTAFDANGDPLTSYKRIQLRNSGNDNAGAHMRDPLAQMLAAEMDVEIQANRTVMVFINGEFWGVYSAQERYDDHYFHDVYGVDRQNVVVMESPSPLETEDRDKWRDYELTEGVPGDELAWESLMEYIKTYDMTVDEHFWAVSEQIDLDNLIDTLIANLYVANADWPTNNVKVWRNKNPDDPSGLDTKWRFVLMDMDKTLGSDYDANMNNINHLISNSVLTRISARLLYNEQFRARFIERFEYATNVVFEPEKCIKTVDAMFNEMVAPMQLHCQRWTYLKYSNWQKSTSSIKTFLTKRPDYVLDYMYAFFKSVYKYEP